jgi:hypothetical protein
MDAAGKPCFRDIAGQRRTDSLVQVAPGAVAAHTAIVAQSGSGKSFFLGTFVEELLLNTRARCVIFDPNADFRRVDEIRPAACWTATSANPTDKVTVDSWLPYDDHASFSAAWNHAAFEKEINYGPAVIPPASGTRDHHRRFQVWLPDIDSSILVDGLDRVLQTEVEHCHQFVAIIGALIRIWCDGFPVDSRFDLVRDAEELFQLGDRSPEALQKRLTDDFCRSRDDWGSGHLTKLQELILRAVRIPPYVSPEAERFYFGKVKSLVAGGIVRPTLPYEIAPPALRVLDLPSFSDANVRRIAVSALLHQEWRAARANWGRAVGRDTEPGAGDTRVPTFIIVDEAHNLMPRETQGTADAALREQFRTIVAEGRKYGVFLVLVTQRPDKVDPMILSECENVVIMKLSGQTVAKECANVLGLQHLAVQLRACTTFTRGCALIAGPWVNNGTPPGAAYRTFYAAARRTMEGGGDLDKKHWAQPRP